MSDLYRRLLTELTQKFGGTIDDANADAIAYAAAELYHRDFEPRLWQEKSAHDLLDVFGIPRAGSFAPYSLSDRLVLLQKRSSQAQYVTRAHELLTSLGVPRHDANGEEHSLKWRLDRFLAVNGLVDNGEGDRESRTEVAGAPETEAGATEDAEAAKVEEAETAKTESADDEAKAEDAERDEGETEVDESVTEASPEETGLAPSEETGLAPPEGAELAPEDEPKAEELAEAVAEAVEEAFTEAETEDGPDTEAEPEAEDMAQEESPAEPDEDEEESVVAVEVVDDGEVEPNATQLADAVRALEQAAQVEAELTEAPAGVDVVRLTETLNSIQSELVLIREMVEALELGVRDRLNELEEKVEDISSGVTAIAEPPARAATEVTRVMPPVPPPEPGVDVGKRRKSRRVLLVILLVVLALLLAGGIVLVAAVGWDELRSQVSGLLLPLV